MASGRSDAPVAPVAPATTGASARPKRRRLPGVNVRPGAVKQARVEAGLSLAQLGRGHVTAPAIYLIETGRTRPSLPTLEHIARRTNKTVEFFLAEPAGATDDVQARVIELEALVADNRHQDAIAFGTALLDRGSSAFRMGRIRYLLAQAYIGVSQPERATPLLVDARAHFEAINDGTMLAECIGVQAVVATLSHGKDAAYLAEMALSVCRALRPVPAPMEARLLGILADAHAAAHEWERAVTAYEEAIRVGSGVSDLRHAARGYLRLGVAYRDAGQVETAARYTSRSVALLELFRDRDALAKSEHSLAMVLITQGDYEAARQHLHRALELCAEYDLGCGRSVVLLGLSELAIREGDVERAHKLATDGLELAERLEEAATIAEAHVALGRIADLQGDPVEADRQFEGAIRGFDALGLRERLLQVHGAYAEVLERRGEFARAYDHMKEALQASRPGLLRRENVRKHASSA